MGDYTFDGTVEIGRMTIYDDNGNPIELSGVNYAKIICNNSSGNFNSNDFEFIEDPSVVQRFYELNYNPFKVNNGVTLPNGSLHIENTVDSPVVGAKGAIQVVKKDNFGRLVGGATYGLYNSAGTLIKSGKTSTASNNLGLLTFTNLDDGTYIIREISPPSAAYKLDTTVYTVHIDNRAAITYKILKDYDFEGNNHTYDTYMISYGYNAKNYVENNPDLAHAFSYYENGKLKYNYLDATTHFLSYGVAETAFEAARNKYNNLFDPYFYLSSYSTVRTSPYYTLTDTAMDGWKNFTAFGEPYDSMHSPLISSNSPETNMLVHEYDYTVNSDIYYQGAVRTYAILAHYQYYGADHNLKTMTDEKYLSFTPGKVYDDDSSLALVVSQDDYNVPVTVVKSIKAGCEPIYENNGAYSLEGTEIGIYDNLINARNRTDDWIAKFVLNADGSINFTKSSAKTGKTTKDNNLKKILLSYSPANLYGIELKAGKGYKLSNATANVTSINYNNYDLDHPITFNITNEPKSDPINLQLKKVNPDGSAYEGDGNIDPNGAEYLVEQYYCTYEQYLAGGQIPVATATFTTSTHIINNKNTSGVIDLLFDSPTSGSLNRISVTVNDTNYYKYPIGFYVMKETKAPEGLLLSDDEFYCQLSASDDTQNTSRTYWKKQNGQTTQLANEIAPAENIADPVTAATKEPIIWYNLALVKDDKELGTNSSQGVGTLEGAEYYIYTTDNTIFNHRNEYDGHTYSVDNQNRILVDGNILKITTDKYGFGETPYPVIWSDKNPYYTIEAKASVGYVLNTDSYSFTMPESRLITTGENKGNREIVKKTIPNTTYSVDSFVAVKNEADYNHAGHHPELPIRGDLDIKKYNIDGYSMAYIPFLISMLDDQGNVIEQHVIMTDSTGNIQTKTRQNKSKLTVNTLDAYYNADSKSYTGPLTDNEASINIWFGDIADYEKDTAVNNNRGSLLYGNYKVEELRCANNSGHEMLTGSVTVTENGSINDLGKVLIDLDIVITSDSLDVTSDSKSVTINDSAEVADNLSIDHLKVGHHYRLKTFAYNIVEGQDPVLVGFSDYLEFTPTASGNTETINNFLISNTFNLDTTNAVPGSYIALEDRLYEEIDGSFPTSDDDYIAIHNREYDIESQKLFVPDMTTEAFNDSTNRLRIGSIDPPSEIDDTITYKNLGDKTLYKFTTELVYDDGTIVKDVNGKDCTCTLKMYTDNRYLKVSLQDGTIVGPASGSFKLSDVGIAPFVISAPETTFYVTEKLDAMSYDAETGNPIYKTIVSHNLNRDEEIETIRYIIPHTTAGSVKIGTDEIAVQGLVPNDTDVTLRDIITYTNVAQPVEVYIEGQVVEKDNPDNIVAENNKTVNLPTTLDDNVGETYIDFTFDTTPYAEKKLVVFEKIYLIQDDKKILLAAHSDVNDENQTVRVPSIHTDLTTKVDNVDYKVIQNVIDVKLVDTVTYTNLKPGVLYTMTAVLKDKKTGETVIDAETGEPVTNTVEYLAEDENGTVEVPLEFKRVVTDTKVWDEDEGYVAFESTKPKDEPMDYAVHNDIHDERQTVDFPKYITHAANANDYDNKNILPLPDQTITDTITLKNFGLPANIKDGDKFTLKIEAIDAETEKPIKDKTGKPYTATKVMTYKEGMTEEKIDITIDATGLEGKIIVFYETLYYGTEKLDKDHEVLREDESDNLEQSVYVPTGHTTALDSKTKTHQVPVSKEVTIIDTVYYENLCPNLEYSVTGTIYSVKTGKPYKVDGKTFSNTIKFTPDTSTGSIEVPIKIDTTALEGESIVVFEDVLYKKYPVFVHHNLKDKDQTVYVPKIGTKAVDETDHDNILDGTKTEQTIIDTVHYTNLIPGEKYTIKGKLVVKPKDKTTTEYEYVKDANGKIVESKETFIAKKSSGDVDIKFTIDASKYAGEKIVVFEDLYYKNVEFATHSDIEDKDQTLNVSLRLHVKIGKADKDNIKYFLKDAEITIFNQDGTIAKDVDGKDCVGMTNDKGEVDFTILYDENNTYYAQETKAPKGYNLNKDKFEIKPSGDRETLGTDLIKINILDSIIIIPPKKTPPKTDDIINITYIISMLGLGIIGIMVFRKRKKH